MSIIHLQDSISTLESLSQTTTNELLKTITIVNSISDSFSENIKKVEEKGRYNAPILVCNQLRLAFAYIMENSDKTSYKDVPEALELMNAIHLIEKHFPRAKENQNDKKIEEEIKEIVKEVTDKTPNWLNFFSHSFENDLVDEGKYIKIEDFEKALEEVTQRISMLYEQKI